jgi:hypothetical protein
MASSRIGGGIPIEGVAEGEGTTRSNGVATEVGRVENRTMGIPTMGNQVLADVAQIGTTKGGALAGSQGSILRWPIHYAPEE